MTYTLYNYLFKLSIGLESEAVEWKIKPRSEYGHASQTSQASHEGLNVPRLKKSSMNAFKQSEQDLR